MGGLGGQVQVATLELALDVEAVDQLIVEISPGELSEAGGTATATVRLVPPESALAIVPQLKDCTVTSPRAGHVGMVVGSKAENALWKPLVGWLKEKGI